MSAPSPVIQFPNKQLLLISNIASMRRDRTTIRFRTVDGREIEDPYDTAAAAAIAYDAYVVLIVAYGTAIYYRVPNDDVWAATAAPVAQVPTDQSLPCLFHGSSDGGTSHDTLYAWNTSTLSWVGIIIV